MANQRLNERGSGYFWAAVKCHTDDREGKYGAANLRCGSHKDHMCVSVRGNTLLHLLIKVDVFQVRD